MGSGAGVATWTGCGRSRFLVMCEIYLIFHKFHVINAQKYHII